MNNISVIWNCSQIAGMAPGLTSTSVAVSDRCRRIVSSATEVGMDQGPEGRANARSDEPEARSAAGWRVRAAAAPPVVARWPELASCPLAGRWLAMQADLGR
jgi:hypothetical protein